MTMAERRTSTLFRALAIGMVTFQLSWTVESIVAHGARHNQLEMTGDVHADYKAYMKMYPDLKRDPTRFEYFNRNYEKILAHDAEKTGYSLGLTEFTGYTDEELALMRNNELNDFANDFTDNSIVYFNSENANKVQPLRPMDEKDIPASHSWLALGKVSPVVSQGQCGSCYAFAAIAAVDSAYAIKTGKVFNFSPQQYVSCTVGMHFNETSKWHCNDTNCYLEELVSLIIGSQSGNKGCNGGHSRTCWLYQNVTGQMLNLDTCYPYISGASVKAEECKVPTSCSTRLSICGYVRVRRFDAVGLKSAIVNYGPAACYIIVQDGFGYYKRGIFHGSRNRTNSNHAITVVGFSRTKAGKNYWIVKNSWGDSWGMGGYVWINGDDENDIGITSFCAVPILC